jgi:hypothetical protein
LYGKTVLSDLVSTLQHVPVRLAVEGRVPGEHFKKQNADGPEIGGSGAPLLL